MLPKIVVNKKKVGENNDMVLNNDVIYDDVLFKHVKVIYFFNSRDELE
jgi:hypothetical protein